MITFNSAPDYETKNSYSITVNVNDGANTTSQSVTINVTNVNDNDPSITSASSFSAAENQTSVGTVTASDADGDTLTYSLSGTDASSFSINASSGVITFNSAPDYETKTSYSVTITASDGTNTDTQSITINVTNVNDISPVISSSATFSANENQTSVGTASASDVDGDTLTYSLSGTDASSLSIGSSSGVITFDSAPNHESKSSYSIIISAFDGVNSSNQNVTITINDLPDVPPTITSASTVEVWEWCRTNNGYEEAACGDAYNLPSLARFDLTGVSDTGSALSWSISGGADKDKSVSACGTTYDKIIYIITSENRLGVWRCGVLDYENPIDADGNNEYEIQITATDGTNSTTQNMTIIVKNANDSAPTFNSNRTFTANENQTNGGTVEGIDADGSSIIYSIFGSSGDADKVSIDSSSGVLTFNSAPDYEAKNRYTFTLQLSDGANLTQRTQTVNINDINERPVITSTKTSFSFVEGTLAAGNFMGAELTAVDPELGDLSDVSGGAMVAGNTDGNLFQVTSCIEASPDVCKLFTKNTFTPSYSSPSDADSNNIYEFTVQASDGFWSGTLDHTLTMLAPNTESVIYSGASHDVDISDDGDVIATVNNGTVKVFDSSESWSQKGADISAGSFDEDTISLDSDGDRFVVGGGAIRVYQYSSGSWGQLGSDISISDYTSADGVQINNDGDRVIAAFNPTASAPSGSQTIIRAYELNSGSWQQLGDDIASFDPDDFAGIQGNLVINNEGTIVAIGAQGDDDNGNSSGKVKVFEYSSGSWSQKGSDLKGATESDQFGMAVSLSGDGNTIGIISAVYADDPLTGRVLFYRYNPSTSAWDARGSILGTNASRFNNGGVSLSNDGSRVAIGNIGGSDDSYKGYAQIFYNTGTEWRSIGAKITGDADNARTAWRNSIGINADGTRMVVGIPANAIPSGTPKVKIVNVTSSNPDSCVGANCSGY